MSRCLERGREGLDAPSMKGTVPGATDMAVAMESLATAVDTLGNSCWQHPGQRCAPLMAGKPELHRLAAADVEIERRTKISRAPSSGSPATWPATAAPHLRAVSARRRGASGFLVRALAGTRTSDSAGPGHRVPPLPWS